MTRTSPIWNPPHGETELLVSVMIFEWAAIVVIYTGLMVLLRGKKQ